MSGATGAARPLPAPEHDQRDCGRALLIIDMINCFDFPEADLLRRHAKRAAAAILRLRAQADRAGIPTVYVNDNFGEWHSQQSRLVERAASKLVCAEIAPRPFDYFVIKPQFSGFYGTNLPVLLPKLGVRNLILTGIATDICILFTAADAHMRDYRLWVPDDAVAAQTAGRGRAALTIMRDYMGAETSSAAQRDLAAWKPSRLRHEADPGPQP